MREIKTCKTCGKQFPDYKDHPVANCPDCRLPYGRTKVQKLKDVLDSIKTKEQRETFDSWCSKRTANKMKLEGTTHRMYTLRRFAERLKKPFKDCKEKDIIDVLNQEGFNSQFYRKIIKQFFKEIGKGEIVAWISTKRSQGETKPSRKMLTDEEIKKIIDNTSSQRDRTILMILAENPTRPKDITNLTMGDVVADEYGFELQMQCKTKSGIRKIRLINSAPDFRLYWNSLPTEYKEDKKHALFYQYADSRYGKPLGWAGMQGALQKAVKRGKLTRPVSLYDFRRTVTTNLLMNPAYTATEVQIMGGWSSIKMFDTYGRVTDEAVNLKKLFEEAKENKKLLLSLIERAKKDKPFAIQMKKAGLLDKGAIARDILKPIVCPRCQTENPATSISCSNCWLPLKKEAIDLKELIISKATTSQKPLTKDMVKEVLREMIKDGEIKV